MSVTKAEWLLIRRPVLGTSGKFVENSRQLSWARSATEDCDKSCVMLRNGCYNDRIQQFRQNVADKLKRHESIPPENLCQLAAYEMSLFAVASLVWFRFCVFGPAPDPDKVRNNDRFKRALRALVQEVNRVTGQGAIHFPVESPGKREFYGDILAGLGVVVRETLQRSRQLNDIKHPSAIVIGRNTAKADRPRHCERVAATVRASGQSVVVCPAVIRDSKCGQCRACASPLVDLVIFPFHA